MRFYKLNCLVAEEKEQEEVVGRWRNNRRAALKIKTKSDEFNEKHDDIDYILSDYDMTEAIIGAVAIDKICPDVLINDFGKAIGIEIEDVKTTEITFYQFHELLETASREDYIEDVDDILAKYDLETISGRMGRFFRYGETFAEAISKSDLVELAKKCLMSKTMDPEIERIYAKNKSSRNFGHPVHYMFMTDDHDNCKEAYQGLIGALCANNRVESRRYAFYDIEHGSNLDDRCVDTLYKFCFGASVVVRYRGGDVEEDDQAVDIREVIKSTVHYMKKYRNDVLTIICLPRECTKIKDIFYEFIGNIGIVEIYEEMADKERSVTYLKELARKSHVRVDKDLTGRVKDDSVYLSNELKDMFDVWYDKKLKTSLYPQYKDCQLTKRDIAKKTAVGSGYDTLQEMIGLKEAKEVINKALNYYKVQKLYKDKGINLEKPAMHMIFTGNPGTAKTTVARVFAKIMKENGLLSKGRLIEVGRGDLVGKYVGWTATIIQEKFKEARGSVLFIDEAYSLVDDRNGSFGDEAINTIVQEMENHRDDVVVIFAGYPDKMEAFLQKNPGLRSRIAFHVPFNDYSTEELCDIAKLMVKSSSTTLTENAVNKLASIFEKARKNADFGNGRYVRNILEMARMNQAGRLMQIDAEDITRKDICTICEADIEIPNIGEKVARPKIGFCV